MVQVTPTNTRVSVDSANRQANGPIWIQRAMAFESDAPNLVSGDTNGIRDVSVHGLP